ncbi:MAG: T9SS type A sorting domain-containing protein, partial [Bacteroidales bacterium]|nr:T9SS type A sorting domain-containing protein [Bacteroidales bacterium]
AVKPLIQIYITRNQISEAQQAIAELSAMTAAMPPQEQEYTNDLTGMFDLGIQLHGITDTTIADSIIASNADWLMPIAGDDNHPYQIVAQVFLAQADLHEVTMPVYLPDTMSNKAMWVAPEPADASSLNPSEFMEVYPNPANDKLSVAYVLPETGNLSLCIFNIKGELIECKPLTEPVGLITFNTGTLRQGTYVVSLSAGNKPSKFAKQFVIAH